MSDHSQKLLNKKQNFAELSDNVTNTLTRIRQANDQLQHNSDLDLDATMVKLISMQKEQIKTQINLVRENLTELDQQAQGFSQRQQIKRLRQVFTKEVERNKQIMMALIRRSFGGMDETDVDSSQVDEVFTHTQVIDSRALKQEQYMAEFESQLVKEKQEDIDRLHREALNLNKIMGQLAVNVNESDEQLDIISTQFKTTKNNIEAANKELIEANKISQSGKKKYIILLLVVFLMTAGLFVSSLFYFDLVAL